MHTQMTRLKMASRAEKNPVRVYRRTDDEISKENGRRNGLVDVEQPMHKNALIEMCMRIKMQDVYDNDAQGKYVIFLDSLVDQSIAFIGR